MPAFGWKLSDHEFADLATYAWGNHASGVSTRQVAKVRKEAQQSAAK